MTDATATRPDRIALGIGLILTSTVFTALQDAMFKTAAADVTLWQIYLMRSVFLIPALLVIAGAAGNGVRNLRAAFGLWPVLRAGLFLCMYMALYASIPALPLAVVAAGIYTAPLFVAGLSAAVLGKPVGPVGWLAIALGFAGVLVILRPGSEAFSGMALVPVLGGFFYALSALATRGRLREVAPVALALALGFVLLAVGMVVSLGLYLWPLDGETVQVSPFVFSGWGGLTAPVWWFVAVLAALMVGNGLVLPAAYQLAPSVMIATFDYCYLIWAALFGLWLFGEVPDWQTVVGTAMIAVAGVLVARG